MNKTQLQTTAASLVGVLAGFAAGHNWLGLDAASWTTIFGALVAIASVVWPIIATRAQSLKDTVGHLPSTTVVTDRQSAAALPDNPDVVASTPEIVKAIENSKG